MVSVCCVPSHAFYYLAFVATIARLFQNIVPVVWPKIPQIAAIKVVHPKPLKILAAAVKSLKAGIAKKHFYSHSAAIKYHSLPSFDIAQLRDPLAVVPTAPKLFTTVIVPVGDEVSVMLFV